MSKVLAFPTKAVRDWSQVERTVRSVLDQSGADAQAKDVIVARFKPFYDLCNRRLDIAVALPFPESASDVEKEHLSAAVAGGMRECELWLNQFVNEFTFGVVWKY